MSGGHPDGPYPWEPDIPYVEGDISLPSSELQAEQRVRREAQLEAFMGWLFRDGGAEPPRREYDAVEQRLRLLLNPPDTPDPRPVSPPSEWTAVLAALDEAMGLTDDEEVAYQIAQARGPIAVLAARAVTEPSGLADRIEREAQGYWGKYQAGMLEAARIVRALSIPEPPAEGE